MSKLPRACPPQRLRRSEHGGIIKPARFKNRGRNEKVHTTGCDLPGDVAHRGGRAEQAYRYAAKLEIPAAATRHRIETNISRDRSDSAPGNGTKTGQLWYEAHLVEPDGPAARDWRRYRLGLQPDAVVRRRLGGQHDRSGADVHTASVPEHS